MNCDSRAPRTSGYIRPSLAGGTPEPVQPLDDQPARERAQLALLKAPRAGPTARMADVGAATRAFHPPGELVVVHHRPGPVPAELAVRIGTHEDAAIAVVAPADAPAQIVHRLEDAREPRGRKKAYVEAAADHVRVGQGSEDRRPGGGRQPRIGVQED